MKKKVWLMVFALIFILSGTGFLVACEKEPQTPATSVSVTLDKNTLEIECYNTAVLKAETDGKGTIEWKSSDDKIVTVVDGTVTAMSVGTATVTASLQGTEAKDTCVVTVIAPSQVPTISFNTNKVSVLEGLSLKVIPSLTFKGETISEAVFAFSVDDENIATVSDDGMVTGVKCGAALLIAQTTWRGEKFSRTLPVEVQPDAGIEVVTSTGDVVEEQVLRASLPEGTDDSYIDEISLSAKVTVKGESEPDAEVVWAVSGSAVSVEAGKVSAEEVGEATVRASYTLENGGTVYTEVLFRVVLPDVNTDKTVVYDRTAKDYRIDFSFVTNQPVTDVRSEDMTIADATQGVLNGDWVSLKADGDYEIEIYTEEVIYVATLKITTKYKEINLSGVGVWNVIDPDDNDLWEVPQESESAITGDRTNIVRFQKKTPGNGYENRAEINNLTSAKYAGYLDYIVFDAYIPSGDYSGLGCFMRNTGDVWLDLVPGKPMNATAGVAIDSEGKKLETLVSDQWMTIIIYAYKYNINRFAFTSPGGNPTKFYISDMRLYARDTFDISYYAYNAIVKEDVLSAGSCTVSLADFNLTKNDTPVTEVDSIVISGGDSTVATVKDLTVTYVAAGETTFNVAINVGEDVINTTLRVSVAGISIGINRYESGTLEDESIEGTITEVLYDGEKIADSSDISAWLNTFAGCSLGEGIVKNVQVKTDGGNSYIVRLTITDVRDFISNPQYVVLNDKNLEDFWALTDYAGKTGVRHMYSVEGCSYWTTRVDFHNNALYNQYDYAAFEVYVEEGCSVSFFLSGPGGAVFTLKEGDSMSDSWLSLSFAYLFDAEGNRLDTFKTGEWVTLMIKTSMMTINRCAFTIPDASNGGEVTSYYVGEMTLWTQENVDTYLLA